MADVARTERRSGKERWKGGLEVWPGESTLASVSDRRK